MLEVSQVPSDYGQQPVELISNIVTMNSTDDSTSLKEGEAQLLENIVRDNGALTVRKGMTTVNAIPLNAIPHGFGTFKPLDSTTMNYATVESTTMYAGSTFPLTSVLTGMTPTSTMRMIPYRGKMLVNDPSKGLSWADGTIGGWAGCASPKVSKLIEGFESTTGWTTTGGTGTVSTTQLDVIQGRNTLKFKLSASPWIVEKVITPIDLTVFDPAPIGDGTASTVNDYIAFRLIRSTKSDFTSCELLLYTDIGYTEYFSLDLAKVQDWITNPSSGASFDFYIRKSAFTSTASASWSTIQKESLIITAALGSTPYIIIDNLRLEKAGPIARPLSKIIGDMESNETWVEATITVSAETTYRKTLARSLKLDGVGASAYRLFGTVAAPTLDLTTFANGIGTADMDSIELYIARDTAKISGTIRIEFYYDATNRYYYTINASDSKGPKITPTLYQRLTNVGKCFTLISMRKDQFLNTGGTPTWSGINRVYLISSADAGAYYIDSIRLARTRDKRIVVEFEPPTTAPTETVTVTNALTYSWADERDELKMIRTDEGSQTSLHVKVAKGTTCTIDVVLSAPINCGAFDGGGSVQDQDLIGPWFWFGDSKYVKNIDILYDVHDGTFSNYYIKSLPRDAIPHVTNNWFNARTQVNEHLYVDDVAHAGTWATVDKVRVQVTTGSGGGCNFYIDQLMLTRSDALNGTMWYRVRYQNSRGAKSEYSNISNSLDVDSSMVLLTDVPTSPGHIRLVERFSTLSNVWERIGTIDDDDTTTFLDWIETPIPGQTSEEKTYGKPLVCKTFCIFKDVVVLGNLTGRDGNTYVADVSVSKEYSFEEFDPLDVFSLGKDDGYKLIALVPALDRVYGFKEKGIYSFDPYNLDQTPVLVSADFGIAGEFAWAVMDKGIAFLTQNKELYLTNGTSFTNIGKLTPNVGNIQSYLDAIPDADIGKVQIAYYNQYLLVSLSTAGVGSELIVNGTFDTDLSSWNAHNSLSGISSWSAGTMKLNSGLEGTASRDQHVTVTPGTVYTLSFDLAAGSNAAKLYVGSTHGGSDIHNETYNVVGSYTETVTASGTTMYVKFWNNEDMPGFPGAVVAYIDNVSLKEVASTPYVLAFYFPTQTWSVFTGWNATILHSTNFSGNAKLLMTSQDLYIRHLFNGNDDAGVAIVGIIQTADWSRDFTILRQPGTLFLTSKAISTNPTIQVTPYYNCAAGTALTTYTVTSSIHDRTPEKNIPPAPSWATYLGLKFTLTKRLSIRGAAYTIQEETRQ